jgi:phenylacetate-CoA ligase
MHQLQFVLAHALKTVPFYRNRLAPLADNISTGKELSMEMLASIPIMERSDIQAVGDQLVSAAIPQDHLPVKAISTSGSTGRPITVHETKVSQTFSSVLNLRNDLMHGRKLNGTLCGITAVPGGKIGKAIELGQAMLWPNHYNTGAQFLFDVTRSYDEQIEWLLRMQPDYLRSYPTNLNELLIQTELRGIRFPKLKGVLTVGESPNPALWQRCRETWGVPMVDAYAAKELGPIALQCPQHSHYHIHSENLIIEILDDNGRPCLPGETGRVIVTTLHNFSTPLIRYAIGDYAEAGEPCPCGRGLPVINRVLGRTRNMLTMPDGSKTCPARISNDLMAIDPILQLQLTQRSLEGIEVRLVVKHAITIREEEQMKNIIHQRFGYPFILSFVYVDDIPRSASGKFEEFRSEVTT